MKTSTDRPEVCWVWILAAMTSWMCCITGQTVNQSLDLEEYLFQTVRYSTKIRPILNQSKPIQVGFSFSLTTIQEVNEVNQHVTVVGVLMATWIDELLSWKPIDYGGMGQITALQNDIWRPNVILGSPKEELNDVGFKFVPVKILYNGTVFWFPPGVFTFGCDINVRYFPLDTQTCYLDFGCAATSKTEINMVSLKDTVTLEGYEENGEWDLSSTRSYTEDMTLNGMEVQLFHNKLTLRRRASFIILHSIMPVILLSVINILVFVLPADSGEKISFSITMFLTFAIFITMLSDTLPRNALHLPYYSVYLITVNVLSTGYVVITVLILKIFHTSNGRPVPRLLCYVVHVWNKASKVRDKTNDTYVEDTFHTKVQSLNRINGKDGGDQKGQGCLDDESLASSPREITVTWVDVSMTMDGIFFWAFLILLVALCVTFMIILQLGGQG